VAINNTIQENGIFERPIVLMLPTNSCDIITSFKFLENTYSPLIKEFEELCDLVVKHQLKINVNTPNPPISYSFLQAEDVSLIDVVGQTNLQSGCTKELHLQMKTGINVFIYTHDQIIKHNYPVLFLPMYQSLVDFHGPMVNYIISDIFKEQLYRNMRPIKPGWILLSFSKNTIPSSNLYLWMGKPHSIGEYLGYDGAFCIDKTELQRVSFITADLSTIPVLSGAIGRDLSTFPVNIHMPIIITERMSRLKPVVFEDVGAHDPSIIIKIPLNVTNKIETTCDTVSKDTLIDTISLLVDMTTKHKYKDITWCDCKRVKF